MSFASKHVGLAANKQPRHHREELRGPQFGPHAPAPIRDEQDLHVNELFAY